MKITCKICERIIYYDGKTWLHDETSLWHCAEYFHVLYSPCVATPAKDKDLTK